MGLLEEIEEVKGMEAEEPELLRHAAMVDEFLAKIARDRQNNLDRAAEEFLRGIFNQRARAEEGGRQDSHQRNIRDREVEEFLAGAWRD